MDLPFATLDVFTSTRFEGNPLAVVRVPAGVKLSQEKKQLIAREFNFSETVFLHDEAAGSDDASATHRVDIFTTTTELPFAGHPTIGTACYVLRDGVVGPRQQQQDQAATLQVKAGLIPIEHVPGDDNGGGLGLGRVRASVPHDVHVHRGRLQTVPSLPMLQASGALSFGNAAIAAAELAAPPVSIVKGMAFLLVPLPSLELLAMVGGGGGGGGGSPLNLPAVDGLLDDGPWNEPNIWRYYYVLTSNGDSDDDDGVVSLRTRMVEDRIEDPATGSAACALTSYLTLQNSSTAAATAQTRRYEVVQGVEMGRRSVIEVEVRTQVDEQGTVGIESVFMGGNAVEVTQGVIHL